MKLVTQIATAATALFRSGPTAMKHLSSMALMLAFGVATVNAQEMSVKLTFSGTSETSPTPLQQPNTSNDGDNFAGKGTLGSFTLRNIRAIANSPTASSTCSGANQLYLAELAGGGVFRFSDGSLLSMLLTGGADCIDLATNIAHCKLTFQITGGTGRFKNASGVLTMTETVSSVLSDALNNPVLFTATGEFTGMISGVIAENEDKGEQQ
jgi:hypothetical protein